MVSKLEVNIRSLLLNCEELSKDETNFWRLKKFIKSLDTMIDELDEKSEEISILGDVSEYRNRLTNLKSTVGYTESPSTSKRKLQLKIKRNETGDDLVREMNQLQTSQQYFDLRKDLIDGGDNLRKRNVPPGDANMDQAMKYFSNVQEKITEDMLALTRNLKEQTETANKIIKRDTEIVKKSTQMSDSNINALSKEAEKLQDHSRKACKCWLWMMICLVMLIFIFMVLFMKVMKKRT